MQIIGLNCTIALPDKDELKGTILSTPTIGDDQAWWFIPVLVGKKIMVIDIDYITVEPQKITD